MRRYQKQIGRVQRRGIILVIVLVVVAALVIAAYSFGDLMISHSQSTDIVGRQVQARYLSASGVEAIRGYLMNEVETQIESGGHFDNPTLFQAVSVLPEIELRDQGFYTVVAPFLDDQGVVSGIRYGLENESGRVNLNALLALDEKAAELEQENFGRDMLLALPNMTEDVADAILDWMDADDEPREYGAEFDAYADYGPKNGPLETVEELLLVYGVTPELLFGSDVNRNGMMDASEAQLGDEADASMARGWHAYMTLHSREQNVSSMGEPRINLNEEDLENLQQQLAAVFPEDWVTFILAYRIKGAYDGSEAGKESSGGQLDLGDGGDNTFSQVLDLIDTKVEIQFQGEEESTVLASPFQDDLVSMGEYMELLMDYATVVPAETIPGRININHAPYDILIGIPGMTEEVVGSILAERAPDTELDDPGRIHETWLLTEGLVTLEEMRAISPFVCTGGDVYRTQVVGFYGDGHASARLEVLLDATQMPARILLWRDISHLGRGYSLEFLGVGDIADQ